MNKEINAQNGREIRWMDYFVHFETVANFLDSR